VKPLTALYPRLSAFSNLREAARSAERGKRFHADVLAFLPFQLEQSRSR